MTYNEYTLSQWIAAFQNEVVNIDTIFLDYALSDGATVKIFPEESILTKYRGELNEYLTTIKLTQKEYQIYEYNPHKLAYKLYGNANYWFLILYANELHSVTEFTINPIKVYSKRVNTLLTNILTIESSRINENSQMINDIITNNTIINHI